MLGAHIASTVAALVPGVSVTTLGEAQIVTADATTNVVTLSAGVAAPVPGQILASEKGGGVLATVIQSSAQPDGTTAVITTPAALGDVVSQLEFSGSFSLSPVRRPVAARAALQSLGVPTQSNQGGTLSMTWPQTGFTLTSDVTQPDRPAERTQTLRQSQATSSGLIVV